MHSQIHLNLCSTYLLNDKNYEKRFLSICFYRLCLVRLIYFCRLADFKLQRNKLQGQKFSFAVIEKFDTDFIASLLNEKTTEEAGLVLRDMYPNKREPSIRSSKGYCAKRGISKRILQNMLDNMAAVVFEELSFRSRHNKVYMSRPFPRCYF